MTGQKRNQENPMPMIDEGWWSSVLAEESRSVAHAPVHSAGGSGYPCVGFALVPNQCDVFHSRLHIHLVRAHC